MPELVHVIEGLTKTDVSIIRSALEVEKLMPVI